MVQVALEVLSHQPEHNEELVDFDQIIKIEFTDDIDSKSLNESSFMVYEDNKPIEGQVSYLARRKTATFKPSSRFKPATEYRVVLSGKIQSITGEFLQSGYAFFFKTQEDDYKLNRPQIAYPADGTTVNNTVIKWAENKFAESYAVEISDRPDFSNLVFSTLVVGNTEVNANLTSGKEYYLRIKAKDVFQNDPEKHRVLLNTDELSYYGSNYFETQIGLEYCPIHTIEKVYLEDKGDLKILDDGKSKYGDAYIKSASSGIITFNYPFKTGKDIYIDLTYLPAYQDSEWSDTVSFYYDKTEVDFEELINALGEQKKFIEISDRYQVSPDTDFIYLKLYYGYLDVDDVEISIDGSSINDSPYYESDGVLDNKKPVGFKLTTIDLDQMALDRYEYSVDSRYLPLDSISSCTLNGQDISDDVEIVDKKRGLISINHAIQEGQIISLSLDYSTLQVVEQTETYTLMRFVV